MCILSNKKQRYFSTWISFSVIDTIAVEDMKKINYSTNLRCATRAFFYGNESLEEYIHLN
jgi:hypothetical protein